MSKLRDDLLPILQTVADVRLGDSLYPHADQIIDLMREALLDSHVVAYAHRKVGGEYVLPAHLTEGIAAALDAVTGEGGER